MAQQRDWTKDHALKRMGSIPPKHSLNQLVEGAGKPLYSKATQSLQIPKRGRRIDPNSPEGKAIAARFNVDLT